MPDKVFNQTTGAQSWDTAGNWTPSGVPVTGDRAFINSGDASLVITRASTQAAVLLAECIGLDTFLGQFDVDVHATIWRIGFPSGGTNANGGPQKWVISNGSDACTVLGYKCGSSIDLTSGLSAIRFHGTHATANAVYVMPGVTTLEIGTSLAASVVTTLDVQGGNVIVRQNATTKFITVTSGTLTHTGLSNSAGTLLVSGGTVTTTGDTKHPTITANGGTCNLSHRASSGDSAVAVTINSGGTVDLRGDPRAFAVTTSFTLNNGGNLLHFGLSQITGASLTVPVGSLKAAAA